MDLIACPVQALQQASAAYFIAITDQLAQLRHVAPLPAVGASINCLFGRALLHLVEIRDRSPR